MVRSLLDNSESDDVGVDRAKCPCMVKDGCHFIEDCECSEFCHNYLAYYTYLTMKLSKVAFFTYNPKPIERARFEIMGRPEIDDYRSDYSVFKRWVKDNFTRDDNIVGFIAVSELTAKAQIHYHVLVKFKDRVTFKKRIVQRLYFQANVNAQYNTPPQAGIHYLFKQQKEMRDYHGVLNDDHIFTK